MFFSFVLIYSPKINKQSQQTSLLTCFEYVYYIIQYISVLALENPATKECKNSKTLRHDVNGLLLIY